jgi:hypothetical protein
VEDDGVVITYDRDIEFYITDAFKKSWRDRKYTITSSDKWREKQRAYMPTLPDIRDRVAEFISSVL